MLGCIASLELSFGKAAEKASNQSRDDTRNDTPKRQCMPLKDQCCADANDEENHSRNQKRQRKPLIAGHDVVLRGIEDSSNGLAHAVKCAEHEPTKKCEDERDELEERFHVDPQFGAELE